MSSLEALLKAMTPSPPPITDAPMVDRSSKTVETGPRGVAAGATAAEKSGPEKDGTGEGETGEGGTAPGAEAKAERDRRWDTPKRFAAAATVLGLREYGFPSELEPIACVDDFGDRGLDGLAVAVGDVPLITDEDVQEAAAAAEAGAPLRILLLQAKRKSIIYERDVDVFGAAAQRFLTLSGAEFKRLKPSAAVLNIWERLEAFRKAAPAAAEHAHVTLIFAYRGEFHDFETVNTARRQAESNIRNALPKMRVDYVIWDANALVAAGERVGPARKRRLDGVSLVEMPPGPAPGFIGFVAAERLVDMVSLETPRGRQVQDVFFLDNVRAFMGDQDGRANPGAVGVGQTLLAGRQDEMLACHNGVVIVASRAERRPDGAIELIGPQIVNGCQSVNVMAKHAERLKHCAVPVKIVATEDEQLKDAIVLASNTQAAVDNYDILARHPGLRALEKEFQRGGPHLHELLFLQRRRNQPVSWPGHWDRLDWSRVLQPRQLLEAYVAAVEGQPELAQASPRKVLALASDDAAFSLDHDPTLYRALGWMVAVGRRWATRTGRRWRDRYVGGGSGVYPARHHFLYALWRLGDAAPDALEPAALARGSAADARFQSLVELMVGHGAPLADAASTAVDTAAHAIGRLNGDVTRTRKFTDAVREAADGLRGGVRASLSV